MSSADDRPVIHPAGDDSQPLAYPPPQRLETMGGPIEVRWEEDPGISPHGALTYFLEFLHISGIWDDFVKQCPLKYSSPNAPSKAEILGTILCGVVCGHRRYAHITAMRADPVLPKLLNIERLRSEDSVRRAFAKQDEDALTLWIDLQMAKTFEPLLTEDWVLDLDATVKTLYGKQEEARMGYNPHKPGRPSHAYQAMVLAAAKLVLNVDVQAGNQTASEYAQPTLWGWLDVRPKALWPTFVRGDSAHGNERMMAAAEKREVAYLFRLRQSPGVAKMIARLAARGDKAGWRAVGQGWEGVESQLQLTGWSRARRVLVLRRKLQERPKAETSDPAQLRLAGCALEHKGGDWYEHTVLVTSWEEREMQAVVQAYRDRGDSENMFDELKNQWGWTGFSTADLKRSQLMARIVALIYNWWSIYTRIASNDRHGEALTTRPLFEQGIARHTRHAKQNTLSLSSVHAKARRIANVLNAMSGWLRSIRDRAEQLSQAGFWPALLRGIFRYFCGSPEAISPPPTFLADGNCRI